MMDFKGQQWGVVGAARTGQATATWLLKQGASVILVDDDAQKLAALSTKLSGPIVCKPCSAVAATDAAAWIVSPGVPPRHPLVTAILAAGKAFSDLDLWQQQRRALTIAVTGTNGKSTVTRMLTTVLQGAGWLTCEGGNIGTPVVALFDQNYERAVLEVSSFQLFYAQTFTPEIAIVTNIFPDHLDWHASLQEYSDAKAKIAAHMSPEHILVLPQELAALAASSKARRVLVGASESCDVRLNGATIEYRQQHKNYSIDLASIGQQVPYAINAAFVVAVAAYLAIAAPVLQQALQHYKALPYRFATVAESQGIRYINDSKATNLHATVSAVKNVSGPVRLLAGGKNKNLDWRSILSDLSGIVQGVYAFGESKQQIAAAWSDFLAVQTFETMAEALRAAKSDAHKGETILLAPGTSSFDQFLGYEDRGRRFDELVKELTRGGHG